MYIEISNPMDYRAALYIRLSKEDENEGPSESVTNQKSLLNDFAEKQKIAVYNTYIDEHVIIGTSGENLVKSRVSALAPFSFLLRDKPKSFKSLKIISERI